MSSTRFDPKGSSSGRRLCREIEYSMFYIHQYHQSSTFPRNLVNEEVLAHWVGGWGGSVVPETKYVIDNYNSLGPENDKSAPE